MRTVVEVEIWSDVVCPWCYIGKRRFDRAVAAVADDIEVRAAYRPFQLDPSSPAGSPTPVVDAYSKKFGGPAKAAQIIDHVTSIAAQDGITFRLDRALRANTFDAHRLLWFADASGHQHSLKQRLLEAYFTDGLDVSDRSVLSTAAVAVGFDHTATQEFLDSDDGTTEVRVLLDHARSEGITAVPTYVVAVAGTGQNWSIPGAQDSEVFERVFRRLALQIDD